MPDRRDLAFRAGRHADVLACFRPLPGGGEHGGTRHHQLHRSPRHPCGGAGGDGMRPQKQLRAESRADERGVDGHLLRGHAEYLRNRIAMHRGALRGLEEMQFVGLPPCQGGVHLHRVVDFHRRAIDGIDLDGRLVERGFRLAARVSPAAVVQAVRLDAVFEVDDRPGARVSHLDAERRVARMFERVGNDQRNHLAAVVDRVVLERQPMLIRNGSGQDGGAGDRTFRRLEQAREVAVVQDVDDARHLARLVNVHAGDAAAGDGAEDAVGMQHAWQRAVGRVEGGAGDLEPAVDTARRCADGSIVHAILRGMTKRGVTPPGV